MCRTLLPTLVVCLALHHQSVAGTIKIRNERVYNRIENLVETHEKGMQKEHPFYFRLVKDDDFFDKYLKRYDKNPERFRYYHEELCRFLEGGRDRHQNGLIPPHCDPPPKCDIPPKDPDCHTPAVPEPDSMMMWACVLTVLSVYLIIAHGPASKRK